METFWYHLYKVMISSNHAFDRKIQNFEDIGYAKRLSAEIAQQDRLKTTRCGYHARQEGGAIRRKIKYLNDKFQRDILRLESLMCFTPDADQTVASKWIAKLKAKPSDLSEAMARNHIMTYLLQSNPCNAFKTTPFNIPPSPNRLAELKAEIPPSVNNMKNVQELYNNTADNGAFLNKLPVPRDGAFFIMHLRPN